jgi:tetratricopeptide (TPR) repeat protein
LSALRGSIVALATVMLLAALAIQLLFDGLYGSVAAPHSLPHHIAGDWPFAVIDRTGLARVAGVRVMLARAALVREEPARARALLAGLPESPDVMDLRGRAAFEAGDPAASLRDFAAAGDFIAASTAIDALVASDPRAALAIVHDFEQQLAERAAAPEIAAEVAWREGVIAATAAARYPADALRYDREALAAFDRALARAPNEEKYLLNAAFAGLRLGDATGARRRYERAAQVVPDSVDAFLGVAVTAAVSGDCAAARAALGRARTFAAEQRRVADPAAAGYAEPMRAALARCSG